MAKRGPTDTDQLKARLDATNPHQRAAEGDVEVVNAAGERKKASLPKRLMAGARDTLSGTDPQPPWPAQLADDGDEPDRAAEFERGRRAALADPDPTLVTGNSDVAGDGDPGQTTETNPPAKVTRELRKRAIQDTEYRVGMAAAKVAGLIELDRWMRLYAVNVQHLASYAALIQEAVEVLQDRQLPGAELRGRFRAQIDEWDRDSDGGGS